MKFGRGETWDFETEGDVQCCHCGCSPSNVPALAGLDLERRVWTGLQCYIFTTIQMHQPKLIISDRRNKKEEETRFSIVLQPELYLDKSQLHFIKHFRDIEK